jgi:hypothetical protein
MTQSLLLDHDLKVANNYERGDYSATTADLLARNRRRPA